MKTKSIRLCALALAMVMALTIGASALGYGQEWASASTTATSSYTDVPTTHWAWDSIQRVSAKNWFSGYPDGSFRPNGTITRAEALKVFVVFLGLEVSPVTQTSFYDVSPSKWYAPYIEAGKDLFPVHTTIQGKTPFQPDMPVTREDTIYALVNALGYSNDVSVVDESVLNMFTDQNSISKSLRPYFAVALQNQLVAGYNDSTIRAQNSLTRAEFATLLYRGSFVGHNDTHTAKISTVTLTPSGSAELSIGETLTLSARAIYTDGTNQPYTTLQPYVASGSGVISLSGTTVTALKEGTATIGFNDSYLKSQTLTVTVKAPTNAPIIKITDYAATTESDTVSVVGTVSDANLSTLSLTVGGKDIIPSSSGSFQTTVALNVGANTITFVAKNQYGVTAQKSIVVTRTEPVKQEPIPQQPQVNAEPVVFDSLWTTIDTSAETYDSFDFGFCFTSAKPVQEYGLALYDPSGNEMTFLGGTYRRKGESYYTTPADFVAGTHEFVTLYDEVDSTGKFMGHSLTEGVTYRWYAYVICDDGTTYYSPNQSLFFSWEGSRFAGTAPQFSGPPSFYDMHTFLDKSWGDDELFFFYDFQCSSTVYEYGVIIKNASTGVVQYHPNNGVYPNNDGSYSYSDCLASICDDRAYDLEPGEQYVWQGYVVCEEGMFYSDECWYYHDISGSRWPNAVFWR